MERRGVRAVMVATTEFADLSRSVAATLGLPSARCAVVAHPLGDRSSAEVAALAAAVVADVALLLTGGAA